jgi:AraC-like DNA-binding protein
MKPQFEQVTVAPGESWTLLWRELPELPFLWHFHPEYELTLTLNARGQRYVGDSLQDFDSGDLVLVGPNQPHTWAASDRPDDGAPMLAIVVWFDSAWLERLVDGWPELAALRRLSDEAGRGMQFSRASIEVVQPLMLSLRDLDPASRLPVVLRILTQLARDPDVALLATHGFAPAGDKVQGRMARVLDRLHVDPRDPPSAQELADVAALSVGAFHRFFKRHTGMTMLDYLAQLRIGIACQLLIDTDRPIGLVAMEAGYGTAAHFNRQFLQRKAMTPTDFRASYRGS